MASNKPIAPITFRPLKQALDTQSAPGEMANGTFRQRVNMLVGQDGHLSTRVGYQRFMADTPADGANADLHDQLLPVQFYYGIDTTDTTGKTCLAKLLTYLNGREVITMIEQVFDTAGVGYLFVGTQSRIYEFNSSTGNWRLLIDGAGGIPDTGLAIRWRVALSQDTVVFTNGVDYVQSYPLGATATGCFLRATADIAALRSPTLNVFSANETVDYNGFVLLANVNFGGVQTPDMVVWSNYKDVVHWIPNEAITTTNAAGVTTVQSISLAGYQSLGGSKSIERMITAIGQVWLFTNVDIWRASGGGTDANGNAQQFVFGQFYEPEDAEGLLAFPDLITAFDQTIWYVGTGTADTSAIYYIDQFSQAPTYADWVTQAAGEMLKNMNRQACSAHTAGTWGGNELVFFSYCDGQATIPNRTFVFNPNKKFAAYLDFGMTAFGSFVYQGVQYTIRDWLRSLCVCTDSGVDASTSQFIKEGLPYAAHNCPNPPQYLWSASTTTFEGITVEDLDGPQGNNGICTALAGRSVADYCQNVCPSPPQFIGALSNDLSLKQIGTVFTRETCNALQSTAANVAGLAVNTTDGQYTQTGYNPVMTMGPILPTTDYREAQARRIKFEGAIGAANTGDNLIAFRVGSSNEPLDAMNTNGCDIIWGPWITRPLRCFQRLSAAQYQAQGIRPTDGVEMAVNNFGRYLYWQVQIAGATSSPKLVLPPALNADVELTGCLLTVA